MDKLRRITLLFFVLCAGLMAQNQPPSFTTTEVTDSILTEDTFWGYDLNANDPENDVLSFSLAPGAPDSMTILDDLGWMQWTPRNADVGIHAITAVVSDGELSDSLTFQVRVRNTNDPPTIVSTPIGYVYEDDDYLYRIVVDDPDVGDEMDFTLNTNPSGLTISSVTADSGKIEWLPDNSNVGWHDVLFTVTDDSGATDQQEYSFEVRNVRGEFTTLEPTAHINEDQTYSYNIESEDEQQGSTVYSFLTQPDWLNLNTTTGVISGTPHNGYVGNHPVSLLVNDGHDGKDTLEFDITVKNIAPQITTTNPITSITEDSNYSYDFDSDDDGQGTVTWQAINSLPEPLALSASTGILSGTPLNNVVGVHLCSLYVDDGNSGRDTLTFNLTIQNNPPNITTQLLSSATEDEAYAFNLSADDEQSGNTVYRFLNDESLDWLSLTDSITGNLEGYPDNSDVGANSVIIECDDGNGGRDTATFNLSVANTLPVITTDYDTTITEDTQYSYDFNSTDDGQGTVLYGYIAKPSWLSLNSSTGKLSGTPLNDDVENASVSIYVSDGNGGRDTTSYTLYINNRPPVITSTAPDSTGEDVAFSYDIESDDEGLGATYSWVTNPGWLTLVDTSGIISGTPDNSDVPGGLVAVQIDDGQGGVTEEEFYLNVVNLAPVFSIPADTAIAEDSTLTINIDTDDEGDPSVTYTLIDPPDHMSITASSGVLSFTPDNAQVNTYTIQIQAQDNHLGRDTLEFNITVNNSPPTITSTPTTTTVNEGNSWEYDIASLDENVGSTRYSFEGTPPGWLSLDPDSGIVSGDAINDYVDDWNVSVRVDDGNGGFDIQNWTLTVNNVAPEFATLAVDNAREDSLYQFDINAVDEADAGVSFTFSGDSPSWLSLNTSTGLLSGTPDNLDVGDTTFTIQLDDGNGGTATKNFDLTVVNSKPIFTTTADIEATEDQNLNVDLETNDEGNEGTGSSGFSLIDNPPDWLSIIQASGELSGIPRDDDVGTFDLQVKYLDGNGGIDTLQTNLIVSNTPPVFTTTNPTATGTEDQAYSFQFETNDDSWVGVTFDTLAALPAGLSLSSAGLLSGNPLNAAVGTNSVGIIAIDANDGRDTLNFNLVISNQAPAIDTLIINPAVTTIANTSQISEDISYSIDINADDENDGEGTVYSVTHRPDWLAVSDLNQGKFSGTPDNGDVGRDSLAVTFSDGHGGSVDTVRYFDVTNVAPELSTTGPFTAIEDSAFAADINSSDEGQGSTQYSFVSGNPGWLSLNTSTGVLGGTPDNDDVTPEGNPNSVVLKVMDGNGGTAQRTYQIRVTNTNDPPQLTAVADTSIDEDVNYAITLSGSDGDSDDVLHYYLITYPGGMTLDSTSGELSWQPENDQVGDTTVTAQVRDSAGETDQVSWDIIVRNVTPIITAVNVSPEPLSTTVDTFTVKEDKAYDVDAVADDENYSGVNYQVSHRPDWLGVTNLNQGEFSGTPDNGDVGQDSLSIIFNDGNGARDTVVKYFTVQNKVPILYAAGPFTAHEDSAFTADINSSDEGQGNTQYSFISGNPGWLTLNSTSGQLGGTPGNADTTSADNPHLIVLEVDDGNGGTDQKSYQLAVANTNDDPQLTALADSTINEDELYTDTLSITDIDEGDTHRFYLLDDYPGGMTIDSTAGIISWTPDNSHVASNHPVAVKVVDGSGGSDSTDYSLSVNNRAPQFTSAVITDATEDAGYQYDPECDDEGLGTTAYELIKAPAWLNMNAVSGKLTGMPDNSHVSSDSVVVKVDDGNGAIAYQRWLLTVANVPPQITSAAVETATEEEDYVYDVACDDDGQGSITYAAPVKPDWLAIDALQGILSGTPQNDDVGDASVMVTVTDGNGGSDSQTFTLTVINTNDAPQITSAAITTAKEDSLYLYDVNAEDSDGDTITYTLVTAPNSMTIDSSSGLIRWTPDNRNVGEAALVSVSVTDGNGDQDTQSWSITVSNSVPQITTRPEIIFATEDQAFTYDFEADDEAQGETVYRLLRSPDWVSLENTTTGVVSGTPTNRDVATGDSLWVEFDDGNSGLDTLKTALTISNTPPNFVEQADTAALEDSLFTLDLACDDEGYGDIAYAVIGTLPGWLTLVDSSGILSGTPLNADVGSAALSIKVNDGHNGRDTLNFLLTITNRRPQFVGTPTASVYEDSSYHYDLNVDDEGSGSVIYTLLSNPGWLILNTTTGILNGTPRNNDVGSNTVEVKAEDGNGGLDSLEFIIDVINTPPRITTTPTTSAQEDIQYRVDFNCTDEGQGTMLYNKLLGPDWLVINAGTGLLKGTPLNQHVTTADSIVITVSDGQGGSDTLGYNLAVSNKSPAFTTMFSDTSIVEDDVFNYDFASDDEGQGDVIYSFVNQPPEWLQIDSSSGTISGTPLNNHIVDSLGLQLKVDDGNGAADYAVFYVTVLNNPPQFTAPIADSIATENQLFTYDADTDDEAQGTAYYALIGTYPNWLALVDSAGILRGTPANADVDTSSIQLRFYDGNGGTIDQQFQLIVENVNDDPFITTTRTTDSTQEDILWAFTCTAEDSDLVHGDVLTFSLADQPAGMSINAESGVINWTPDNDAVGVHTFAMIVEDEDQVDDSLEFELIVENVNDTPWIISQADTLTLEDSLFTMSIKGQDVDVGDELSYNLLSAPPGMSVVDSTGEISWIPDNSQIDDWQVISRVQDLSVTAADTDTFILTVQNVNDAPLLAKDIMAAEIMEDSLWQFQLHAMDPDSNYNEVLTYSVVNAPQNLTLVDSTGYITWRPRNEHVGRDSVYFYVKDLAQAYDSLLFYLTVINTNDAPQLATIADTIAYEDSLFQKVITYFDVDVGDSAEYALISAPEGMQLDSLTGQLTWLPGNANRDQNYTIEPCVIDGAGAADTTQFDIYVNNVNDAPVLATLETISFPEDSSLIIQYRSWSDKAVDIDHPDSVLTWEIIPFETINFVEAGDSVRFFAPADWFGRDTSMAVVSDGELTDSTQLVIRVEPVNDSPQISAGFPDSLHFPEDDTTYLNLNEYISDVDNDTLEINWSVSTQTQTKGHGNFQSIDQVKYYQKRGPARRTLAVERGENSRPCQGIALINAAGDSIIIEINPATNHAKFYAQPDFYIAGFPFIFTANDSVGPNEFGSDSASLVVTVDPVNDAPVLDSLPAVTVREDSLIQMSIREWFPYVRDVDDEDSLLTWQLLPGNHSLATLNADSLRVTPEPNWFGRDTLPVIVGDGLLQDTVMWQLRYQSINDPPLFTAFPDTSFDEDDTLFIDLNQYIDDIETPDSALILKAEIKNASNKKTNPLVIDWRDKRGKSDPGKKLNPKLNQKQDSLTVQIDQHTHIAAVFGPPNYYTDPVPIQFTVIDDSLAKDSVLVNIGIEAVNDKPVIQTLPPIVYNEDEIYICSLSNWDSLVYDVEDPDSLLRWQFGDPQNIILEHDSLNRRLLFSSPDNWYGNDSLSVWVTDQGGLKDTTELKITISPVNDPPRIDSLLYSMHFYQNDTLIYDLDTCAHDFDTPLDSLNWQFEVAPPIFYEFEDSSHILSLWSAANWFGRDSIKAQVRDTRDSTDIRWLTVTVSDTTPPTFRVKITQNKLISRKIDIRITPSEQLSALPQVFVAGDSMELADSTGFYMTKYEADSTGELQVLLKGYDRAGNLGTELYVMCVNMVSVQNGGALTGENQILSFLFSANTIKTDVMALLLPIGEGISSENDGLAKTTQTTANGRAVSPPVELVMPYQRLKQKARVLFDFDDLDVPQQDANYLGIYYKKGDLWEYLPTYTSLETGAFWAYSDHIGTFQVWVNTAKPVVVIPEEYNVSQNYPNPFNARTTINYLIGAGRFQNFDEALVQLSPVDVSVRIYNLLGQEVCELVNEIQLPGRYTVIWNGRNNMGRQAASGLYIYQVILGEQVFHKKMTILR